MLKIGDAVESDYRYSRFDSQIKDLR